MGVAIYIAVILMNFYFQSIGEWKTQMMQILSLHNTYTVQLYIHSYSVYASYCIDLYGLLEQLLKLIFIPLYCTAILNSCMCATARIIHSMAMCAISSMAKPVCNSALRHVIAQGEVRVYYNLSLMIQSNNYYESPKNLHLAIVSILYVYLKHLQVTAAMAYQPLPVIAN